MQITIKNKFSNCNTLVVIIYPVAVRTDNMKRNGFFLSLLFVLFFNSCFFFITTCYEQIGPLKQNISHLPLQVKTFFISCKCSCQPAFMRHKLQEKNGNFPNQSSLKAIEQIGYSNTYSTCLLD